MVEQYSSPEPEPDELNGVVESNPLSLAESSAEPRAVARYRRMVFDADNAYRQISPIWRLRLAGLDTLAAQIASLIGFITWGFSLNWARMSDLFDVSRAYAQAGSANFEPKPYINLAVFIALFSIFILSVWVNYFSKSPAAAQRADSVSKALLGFFIGAASNYLGLGSR